MKSCGVRPIVASECTMVVGLVSVCTRSRFHPYSYLPWCLGTAGSICQPACVIYAGPSAGRPPIAEQAEHQKRSLEWLCRASLKHLIPSFVGTYEYMVLARKVQVRGAAVN